MSLQQRARISPRSCPVSTAQRTTRASHGAQVPTSRATSLLYASGTLSDAWLILPKACLALRRRRPGIKLLTTVAVTRTVLLGEWFEASTVAFLFAFSLMLESWSVSRARRAIAGLMDLCPPVATILDADGVDRDRPLDDVAVGMRVLLRPGQRFPLDGTVLRGRAT